jgi:DNA-directed RNA polymerase subunit RPC12/RpoP
MAIADQLTVTCGACGKKNIVDAAKGDRQIRCPGCGQLTLVGAPRSADADESDDPYDLADVPVEAAPAMGAAPITAEEVLAHLGHAHVTKKRIEPDADELEARRQMETLAEPAPVREVIIPLILIAIGLVLSYCEVMYATRQPLSSAFDGVVTVVVKAALSMALSVGGVFLATTVFEVCILGSFQRSILRICAIGIAPSALYGILCYTAGDLNGSLVGVFASVLAYGLLYYFLLRLDLKDTSICVLVTWILITAINYAAYKVHGAQENSWF